MRYTSVFILLFFMCASISFAHERKQESIMEKDITERLAKLADIKLRKDFRIVFKFEKDSSICGGVGDAYVGQVEVNKPVPFTDPRTARPIPKDRWVKIQKYYSIFADDLSQPSAQLFDMDNCLE